jgi:hypothetical protein
VAVREGERVLEAAERDDMVEGRADAILAIGPPHSWWSPVGVDPRFRDWAGSTVGEVGYLVVLGGDFWTVFVATPAEIEAMDDPCEHVYGCVDRPSLRWVKRSRMPHGLLYGLYPIALAFDIVASPIYLVIIANA